MIIIMTTFSTSTNNKDYFSNNDFQDDDHSLCLFSYFCAYLFSGWRSYISVSLDVNQTATTRDCWTLVIQSIFGHIWNENSISVKINAIYSSVTNVIRIKSVNLLTIHIRVDIRGKRWRGYFCESKFLDRIFHAYKYSAPKLAFDRSNNVGPTSVIYVGTTLIQRNLTNMSYVGPMLPQRVGPTMAQRASWRWANVIY